MFFSLSRYLLTSAALFILTGAITCAYSQSSVSGAEGDPVKLFQLGQNAHEQGNLKSAIEFYDAAIKGKGEFPEAEYQRATALVQMGRKEDAEKGYRRAIELRPEWSPPYASLGALKINSSAADEAVKLLIQALTLDPRNETAFRAFSTLTVPSQASRAMLVEALQSLQKLTAASTASAGAWLAQGGIEHALKDEPQAMKSLDRAIALDQRNSTAYIRRAEFRAESNDVSGAIADAQIARKLLPKSVPAAMMLANLYVRANKFQDALSELDSLPEELRNSTSVSSLRNSILANTSDGPEARTVLEGLLQKDPGNAALLSRLGSLYRIDDPARSQEYFKRAVQIDPRNAEYAAGYGAALVQARQFAEAAAILRRVVAADSSNFSAHANLATALYELKSYAEAISEYNWLLQAKPDLAVAYFFIAIAHDRLGEFQEALTAYETFLAKADPGKNQLEIDKVNLRLPSLKNQLKRGSAGKKK
jgi:tetratricopeptide (TPR) repeat protein